MKLSELLKFNGIVIQCHDFPDADTLATGFAIYKYLTANDKKPRLIYCGKQCISKPNLLLMTEKLEIPVEYVEKFERCECLVLADCFYGEGNVTRIEANNIFIIDHHLCTEAHAYRCEIHSNYGCCSSVAAKLLTAEGFNYNEDIKLATALYYGLYTDTNGLNEISHPADRDLRDLTKYDKLLIDILKNSNLSLNEMKIAGDALKHYKYNSEFKFAVVEAMPCDPNILGFISDLLLQVDMVDTCVVFCNMKYGTKLSVRSCVNDIRANELTEFIVKDCGTGGGHAQKSGGYLRTLPDGTDEREFITSRIIDYYKSFDIIYAAEYDIDITSMQKYVKLPVPIGYVKTSDILPEGKEICVRTLEADLNVITSDDLYIMVGIKGEVYPIMKEKFERTYDEVDGEYMSISEYKPSIIIKENSQLKELAPYIHACVSNSSSTIYAKKLERTAKVYTSWDKSNYMLGKVGDYIAVLTDNLHDIYIIENTIFGLTYKQCEE